MVIHGSITFVCDEARARVIGSRWMKSKMPWPPGFRPVMKFDQATGLCGGLDVPSDWMPSACSVSHLKFDMRSG